MNDKSLIRNIADQVQHFAWISH